MLTTKPRTSDGKLYDNIIKYGASVKKRDSTLLGISSWVRFCRQEFGRFPRLVGRYCSYLLPKQAGGDPPNSCRQNLTHDGTPKSECCRDTLTIDGAAVGVLAVAVPGVHVVPRSAEQVPRQR